MDRDRRKSQVRYPVIVPIQTTNAMSGDRLQKIANGLTVRLNRDVLSSRTQLITQNSGLQALSSKESAKNQCVINSVQLLNRKIPIGNSRSIAERSRCTVSFLQKVAWSSDLRDVKCDRTINFGFHRG